MPRSVAAAPFSSSVARFVTPDKKESATTSEDAVHAERHNDDSIEELQKKTASAAEQHKHQHFSKATTNEVPTDSEDAVHGEKHDHDPLGKGN